MGRSATLLQYHGRMRSRQALQLVVLLLTIETASLLPFAALRPVAINTEITLGFVLTGLILAAAVLLLAGRDPSVSRGTLTAFWGAAAALGLAAVLWLVFYFTVQE